MARLIKGMTFGVFWVSFVLTATAFVMFINFNRFVPVDSINMGDVTIPGVMYHHVLNSKKALGDYIISPEQLENDFKFIVENGYSAVLPREVAAAARGEFTLPEKPILISFDDGHKSTFVYAFPLLQKYGLKASLAVIGLYCEEYSVSPDQNPSYAYCTVEDLKEMHESGIVEIANHTYDMHSLAPKRDGIRQKKGELIGQYRAVVGSDIQRAQELIKGAIGEYPTTFVYPYGFIDRNLDETLDSMGFTATVGVYERINRLKLGDPDSAKRLCRFNRPASAGTMEFFNKLLV